MSIHEDFIKSFEEDVFCKQRKMTQQERFMFRAGITVFHVFMKNNFTAMGLDWSLSFQQAITEENQIFLETDWQKQHEFYCANCEEGEEYGRNKQRDS